MRLKWLCVFGTRRLILVSFLNMNNAALERHYYDFSKEDYVVTTVAERG